MRQELFPDVGSTHDFYFLPFNFQGFSKNFTTNIYNSIICSPTSSFFNFIFPLNFNFFFLTLVFKRKKLKSREMPGFALRSIKQGQPVSVTPGRGSVCKQPRRSAKASWCPRPPGQLPASTSSLPPLRPLPKRPSPQPHWTQFLEPTPIPPPGGKEFQSPLPPAVMTRVSPL